MKEIDRLNKEKNTLKKENDELKKKRAEEKFALENLKEKDLRTWTGFTMNQFMVIFCFFRLSLCSEIKRKLSMSPENQLLLTLIKMRHGLTNDLLGFMFQCSGTTAGRIFNDCNTVMHLKAINCEIWPSKKQIADFMPPGFHRQYPKCRVIIDCVEYYIQKPSEPVQQQSSFSTYKNHNTVKSLIGIAPSGAISFISPLYNGSISDKDLTIKSGLMDKLETGDVVLADKGFYHLDETFEERGFSLATPILLKKKQFDIDERALNKNVSNLRVHVERAIGRIKNFKILDRDLSISQMGNAEQIHYVCAFLTLFLDPLIHANK